MVSCKALEQTSHMDTFSVQSLSPKISSSGIRVGGLSWRDWFGSERILPLVANHSLVMSSSDSAYHLVLVPCQPVGGWLLL